MMTLANIAKKVGGQLIGDDCEIASVGIDSRNITHNQLFIGIKGENFDGNTYALEAIIQGAAAVLVNDADTKARPAVVVDDTRLALGELASDWRKQFSAPIVAVTGSNGKTTVKEMLVAILNAATYKENSLDVTKVHATIGNFNNDIGLPLTLLKMTDQHAYVVIEMGMNHLGEINYLTNITQPTVAVITNAGTAHIGQLGSRENIAKAKGEIFAGLADDGVAVINADDDFAGYWKSLCSTKKTITFGLNNQADVFPSFKEFDAVNQINLTTPNGSISFELNLLGQHNIYNALAASACAVALGISNTDIANGLNNMQAVKGRLQPKAGLNGATLIDDTYNANPDSMKAAIDALKTFATHTIFVMGDMGELGIDAAQMHAEIGGYAKQQRINQLMTFGELSELATRQFGINNQDATQNAQHFISLESLIATLKASMQTNVTVLVKGSRFMQMERVINALELKPSLQKSETLRTANLQANTKSSLGDE